MRMGGLWLMETGVYEPPPGPYITAMRPEITRTVEDIQQAIALLRRHL